MGVFGAGTLALLTPPRIPAASAVLVQPVERHVMPNTTDTGSRLDGIDLPTDVADAIGGALPTGDRPATLGEALDLADEWLAPAQPIPVQAFFRDDPTRHEVYLDGSVEYVPCVLDALVVAVATPDDPVRVESTSPVDRTVVEFRVSADDAAVSPEGAVVSFGIAPADTSGMPTADDVADDPRIASCAYINAFTDEAAYDAWVDSSDVAAVLQLSAEEAVAAARRIAAGPMFDAGR